MPADALIFSDKANPDEARTHVLLVGVGHYPNFANGKRDGSPAPLKDLVSPSVSIRAIADWFLDEYNYPPAPLGSVALLTSDTAPSAFRSLGGGQAVPATSTYANFQRAADAWMRRGDGNEASRLIFFFCGHGYGFGSETSLLLSDFDFSVHNPWDSALDFASFHAGLAKIRAAEQIFFLDACRRPHSDLVAPGAAIGRTPIAAEKGARDGIGIRTAPIFHSTVLDEPALAKAGSRSVFTMSFLRAVEGMGARDDGIEWKITGLSMLEAIAHVSAKLTEGDFASPQQAQGVDARHFDFHHLRSDPIAVIYLDRGGNGIGPGDIHFQEGGRLRRIPCDGIAEEIGILLPYGDYNFELVDGGKVEARAAARSAPIFRKATLR